MAGYAQSTGLGAGGAQGEHDVQPTRLHELTYELARLCPGLGRTKLAKLLYLIDLEHFCRRGVTLTGAIYVREKKGPMPLALYKVERDLRGWALRLAPEQVGAYVEVQHWAEAGALQPVFEPGAAEVVDMIVSTYGSMPLRNIIQVVYETEPMRALLELEKETASSFVGRTIDMSRCWSGSEEADAEGVPEDDLISRDHLGDTVERETDRLATVAVLSGVATGK